MGITIINGLEYYLYLKTNILDFIIQFVYINDSTMQQLIVNIKDDSKIDILLNFLKSLNYISVEAIGQDNISFSEDQKIVLDERRASAKAEDFIPWDTAKKQLKFRS